MIKKLRKFTNMTILCITSNEELKAQLEENLKDSKELIFVNVNTSSDIIENNFDIFLVDYCCEIALDIMEDMRIKKPHLPKIVILEDQSEKNIVSCINASAYSILSNPVNYADLKYSIIMALNQSKRVDKILLSEDIYYDSYRERFYNANGAIEFTKYEFQVLKLLLDNHDKIIGYDEIKEKVWKEKKMSIFTMRNVINKIRNKTYYNIIKNNSTAGYQIDTVS
ncbi:MAG: winged helix-turn-helix domain-containing protein [Campylobacterota bacterium]|nr:winged helix-turn-helix domain-containing protein [Campylobacterota bacterium]